MSHTIRTTTAAEAAAAAAIRPASGTTVPVVLTIAGSDPTGGAGLQADLKTIHALGLYGMSVTTALTAQHSSRFDTMFPISYGTVLAQLHAVMEECTPDAIKIGMVGSADTARELAYDLRRVTAPIVLDPVGRATLDEIGSSALTLTHALNDLLPLATIVTPNLPEAAELTGITIDSEEAAIMAGEMILDMGPRHVLIKGGHDERDPEWVTDLLVTPEGTYRFTTPRIAAPPRVRGTGCTLSSAIACYLARGQKVPDAVHHAKEYLHGAIAQAVAANNEPTLSSLTRSASSLNTHARVPVAHDWMQRNASSTPSLHTGTETP